MRIFKQQNLFFVIVALFWFSQYIYIPFFSPYLITIGISATIVGIIVGSYGITQMAFRVPLSILGSRSGTHKKIIGIGIIGVILACSAPLMMDSWVAFLLTRVLAGAASSTWIAYSAYLLEGAEDAANQRIGYLMAANTTGIFSSQIIGTLIYSHVGMRMMFVVAICVASAAFFLLLLTPFKQRAVSEKNSLKITLNLVSVLRNKNFWVCSIQALIVIFLMYATVLGFTGVFAQEALGAGPLVLGVLSILNQFCSMLISVGFGRLGKRRIPERGIMTIAFLLIAAHCFIIPFTNLAGIILIQIVAGIGFGIGNILPMANAGRELDEGQQILSMGLFQTIYSSGMLIGPAFTGFLFDFTRNNYHFTFSLLALIGIAGAVFTIVAYKNPRTR
jgi:MFS family permease